MAFAAVVVALAISGCGQSRSDEEQIPDEEQIRGVVGDYARSLKQDDMKRACALMTPRARSQASTFSLVGPGRCEHLFGWGRPSDEQLPSQRATASGKVAIRGELATFVPGGEADAIGLRKTDGKWKVDSVVNPSLREQPRRGEAQLARGSDEQQIRATLTAARHAFVGEDYARVCKLISPGAEVQILSDGGPGLQLAKSCPKALRTVATIDRDEKWGLTSTLASRKDLISAPLWIRGSRATVDVPGEAQLNLARIDGRWLLDTQFDKWMGAEDYERCWRRAGAQIASSADDLRFAADADQEPLSLTDLSRVSVKGKNWRIFYALGTDGVSPEIDEVIANPRIVPVVAYVRNAKRHKAIVVRARSCGPSA